MVDALASGASIRKDVEVRVLSWAPVTNSYSLTTQQIHCVKCPLGTKLGTREVQKDVRDNRANAPVMECVEVGYQKSGFMPTSCMSSSLLNSS